TRPCIARVPCDACDAHQPRFTSSAQAQNFLAGSATHRIPMLRNQLLDTSRGRIVTLLQHGELTAEEIATKLGLTTSAVRAQITAMERDGVLRRVGRRPGTTRPSQVFELTPEVDQLLSQAYIPLLSQLVRVFSN